MQALTDPSHGYHEEALDALGDDHNAHAQPNIELIHARFAALAKKWAPRPQKATQPYVNAAFGRRVRTIGHDKLAVVNLRGSL